MKRLVILLLAVALVGLAFTGVEAKTHRYQLGTPGWAVVDSLRWSNGRGLATGGYVDTLIASDRDTSAEFTIADAKFVSAMFDYDTRQGTAGGTFALTCSLEVSLNGSDWYRPVAGPRFSTTSSADPVRGTMRVYAVEGMQDSVAAENEVASGVFSRIVQSALKGRFIVVQTAGAADTTLWEAHVLRVFNAHGVGQ